VTVSSALRTLKLDIAGYTFDGARLRQCGLAEIREPISGHGHNATRR
jgi:hypothetical protein